MIIVIERERESERERAAFPCVSQHRLLTSYSMGVERETEKEKKLLVSAVFIAKWLGE